MFTKNTRKLMFWSFEVYFCIWLCIRAIVWRYSYTKSILPCVAFLAVIQFFINFASKNALPIPHWYCRLFGYNYHKRVLFYANILYFERILAMNLQIITVCVNRPQITDCRNQPWSTLHQSMPSCLLHNTAALSFWI